VPNELTIVKYHYVRDLARTRFPAIKGRDLAEFRFQLDHIASAYEVVTAEQVMAAVLDEEPLPADACWLIFENGYLDHYQHVLPLLLERGWQGSFYVPAKTVTERQILDVNKIHFTLASTDQPDRLVEEIEAFCADGRAAGEKLPSFEEYWQRYAHANRWDTAAVIFVKRMLQKGLPEHLRHACADRLFRRYVTEDMDAFAAELYLDTHQLTLMRQLGMHLGSHGYGHYWLDSLEAADQAADLDASLTFLRGLDVDTDRWTMCYPQGAYDDTTLRLLRERNCALAFTNAPGPATIPGSPPLELPTLDTNDLPVC
jgi:peptidoglycan/xylan/chitin deacetylase (PgdA/CDA1 family)